MIGCGTAVIEAEVGAGVRSQPLDADCASVAEAVVNERLAPATRLTSADGDVCFRVFNVVLAERGKRTRLLRRNHAKRICIAIWQDPLFCARASPRARR